jgi:hypothetical protein
MDRHNAGGAGVAGGTDGAACSTVMGAMIGQSREQTVDIPHFPIGLVRRNG